MVDPYEAELAEQAASGGSGSTLGGGFNFSGSSGSSNISTSSDDGGDSGSPTFTRGKPGSRGGTNISGSTIYGGQIISDKTLGRSYDFESEDYQKYLDATGRSMQNPYGNTGLFSGIFGADKVNYNLDSTTAKNILDAGFDRYNDFLGQDSISKNRGFGKLFGGPEGEMTAQGEVRKQVTPMSTSDMAARLVGTVAGLGAPLSMIPGDNIGYAPSGINVPNLQGPPAEISRQQQEIARATGYNPQLDPQVNSDLRSGPFSFLAGGADLSSLGERVQEFLNPLPDAPPSRPQQPVQETREDIINTRTSGFELEDNPNLVADSSNFFPSVSETIMQNQFLNNLLEDGTLYETEGGQNLKFEFKDGEPQLRYSIPFSTA